MVRMALFFYYIIPSLYKPYQLPTNSRLIHVYALAQNGSVHLTEHVNFFYRQKWYDECLKGTNYIQCSRLTSQSNTLPRSLN